MIRTFRELSAAGDSPGMTASLWPVPALVHRCAVILSVVARILPAMAVCRPERSLAVRCPQVAVLWHPDRNEDLAPDIVSVASDLEVWWLCPAGHEWIEPVRDRAAPRKWKHGDIAACGACVGFHALQHCACGRDSRLIRTGCLSIPHECMRCATARLREQRLQRERWEAREAARTDYVPDLAEANMLLDGIVPAGLPPVLVIEWRRAFRTVLLSGMEQEHGYGSLSTPGAIKDALRRIQDQGNALPAPEALNAAYTAGEPISCLGRQFWTHGVLHVLQIPTPGLPSDHTSATSLERAVRAGLCQIRVEPHLTGGHTTAALTRVITDLVEQWGTGDDTGTWNSYFEVVPPFIPSTGSLCGHLDVVLTRPGSRDLVVEIDSTNKDRSMEKLLFAHRAGATAIWIRWRSGTVRHVPGVYVIDLVAETRRPRSKISTAPAHG